MRVVALLLFCSLALAGCSGGGGGGGAGDDIVPPSTRDIELTPTTGAIRGVVIDETVTPIEGATIAVTGVDGTVTSAADGGFVVEGLAPGSYFVTATKDGYQSIQSSAEVVANVEPPLLRILMARAVGEVAYANTQVWSGYTQCGFSASVVFFQACGLVDPRFISYFGIDSIPTFMQAEMHWDSTQALTPQLQLNFYQGGTTDWKAVAGVSPLLITATGEEFVEAKGDDATENPMRVSPPYIQCSDGLTTNPASCDPQTAVIVNVNQAYDVFLTQFYGFTPRDGWLLAVDGPCTAPRDCGGERAPVE